MSYKNIALPQVKNFCSLLKKNYLTKSPAIVNSLLLKKNYNVLGNSLLKTHHNLNILNNEIILNKTNVKEYHISDKTEHKENDVLKKYKEIDNRIIRPINGNEFFTSLININLEEAFPHFTVEEFRKNAKKNLSKIKIFNYALKKIDNHLFWIEKPFEPHIEEVKWSEEEEYDYHLKHGDKVILKHQQIFDENNEVIIPFSFKICQLKNNKTKLTFSAVHSISDGKSMFYLFDLIKKVIKGKSLEKIDESLPSFSQRENFKNLDNSFSETPKVWNEINKFSVFPKVEPPIQYITVYHTYDYITIKKFCKDNEISLQGMLTAALTRAARKYKNLPKETPIWSGTPCDARISPLATDEYKKKKLYNNAGGFYPCIIGQATLMEDFKHCTKQIREAKNTEDYVRQIIACADVIDPKTLKFIPKGVFPDIHVHSVINASNIGYTNGSPLLYVTNITFSNNYNMIYHAYYNSKTLFIAGLMPVNLDEKFRNCIEEELENTFHQCLTTKN